MNYDVETLMDLIGDNVHSLIETSAFQDWLQAQSPHEDDIVVLNNSYIYRKPLIKTSKNTQYPCIRVRETGDGKPDLSDILIAAPGDMNLDFKAISAKSKNVPALVPLEEAIRAELDRLGQLIFIPIGELEECPAEVPVNHNAISALRYVPLTDDQAFLEDSGDGKLTIVINQLTDVDEAWNDIQSQVENSIEDSSNFKKAFDAAFEKLQEEARLNLHLPSPRTNATTQTFLSYLSQSVTQQRLDYQQALDKYEASGMESNLYLKEIMRIAYNFSGDAMKVLQLLVSLADTKAILLWLTLKDHFALAEAFRNLPWTRSNQKPSLSEYQTIINGARNRAFHNLFSFDRTIEADLEGVQFHARRLTLLPAHNRRGSTIFFDYDDREVVEVFASLTRASEAIVPFDFWKKNDAVMASFEKLLKQTETALWALHSTLVGGYT